MPIQDAYPVHGLAPTSGRVQPQTGGHEKLTIDSWISRKYMRYTIVTYKISRKYIDCWISRKYKILSVSKNPLGSVHITIF